MNSEAVANFMAITGSTAEMAEHLISASSGDVDAAISMFYESGLNEPGVASSNSNDALRAPTRPTGPANFETDADIVDLIDDDEDNGPTPVRGPVHGQPQRPQPDAYRPQNENRVRAPVASRREALIDDDEDQFTGFNVQGRNPIVANPIREPFRNFANEASQSSSAFDAVFQPPFDIMYRGRFEDALSEGRVSKKWLLVNVQAPDEFICQVLNRDVWSNREVKEYIKENFVFMQLMTYTPDGQRYTAFYPFDKYPHVAVIDPYTGERFTEFEQVSKPEDFINTAVNFIERFPPGLDAPPPPRKSIERKPQNTVPSEMTDEEMLEVALAASLAESLEQASAVVETSEPPTKPAFLEPVAVTVKDEPAANNPLSTRLQIRMPDGSRVVRRFLKTDLIQEVLGFVRNSLKLDDSAKSSQIELHGLQKSLTPKLHLSLAEAGLENSVITVNLDANS